MPELCIRHDGQQARIFKPFLPSLLILFTNAFNLPSMQKLLVTLVLAILATQILTAQNTWTGSSTSTQTNGNSALGGALSTSVRLVVSNTVNTNQTGISNYTSNTYSGTIWGLYNSVQSTGTGTKYGIYSYMPNFGTGNRYALYAKIDGTGDSRSAFFEGDMEAKGNFIIGANNGKFIFTNGWLGTEDFLAIAPNDAGLANTWRWGRGMTFWESGELAKSIDVATTRAFSINLNGTRTFEILGSGKVYAREVEVSLAAFPDYVFESEYPLLSLNALRDYIAENQHLPNMPSACEVEEKGIGLGDLALKQMEKIEELSLYILQLDERVQKLEQENIRLKEQLSKK